MQRHSTFLLTLVGFWLLACSDSDPASGAGGTAGAGATGGSGATSGSGGLAGTGGTGAGSGASDELCGRRPGGALSATHVLRYESADASIVVQLERTWIGAGVGESQLYRLDGFQLSLDGVPTCVSDAASLEYVNTHHNWTDVARASADGRYEVAMSFGAPHTFAAFAADGSPSLEAMPLIPTGSPPFCWTCPGPMVVSISELMLENTDTLADEAGEYEPWIELFNPASEAVDLSGWTVSDDFTERDKWALPAMTLPGYGLLVLFADGQPDQGPLHTSFALARSGGEVVLTAPDGVTDGGLLLTPQAAGESLGFSWTAGTYVTGAPTPNMPPPEP